ncbi:DUF4392 domain-containing protein [bacterium]|nr:DUF4392 domain-containing protein [candidate division CSSED10-310 bacterium]
MIETIVLEDERRGLSQYFALVSVNNYRSAAEALLNVRSPVLILTGFLIPDAGTAETDGPQGAVVLGRALTRIGKRVIYATDPYAGSQLQTLLHPSEAQIVSVPAQGEDASILLQVLIDEHPGAVIAIERPGPDAGGRCLTCRNVDISDRIPSFAELMSLDDSLTIGIGDGGNELGLGILAPLLPKSRPACHITASYTLIGTTSNWAAFGLVAALELASERTDLLPSPEWVLSSLKTVAASGAVDGLTGKPSSFVDGFPPGASANVVQKLKCLTQHLQPIQSQLKRFAETQTIRYGIYTGDLTAFYDCYQNRCVVKGILAVSAQKKSLAAHLDEQKIPCTFEIFLLSDHKKSLPGMHLAIPKTLPVDILDKPEGHLTTQMTETDESARLLWETPSCLLVQTPDLAVGWSSKEKWIIQQHPEGNPWHGIRRARKSKLCKLLVSRPELFAIAESYLGTPYLLGGRTRRGMDCSAFIQAVFIHAGLWMPRHSADQRKTGLRIAPSAMRPGDLVFAISKKKRVSHVALTLNETLIHASREAGKIICQSLNDFEKVFRIVAVRRIAE